MYRVFSKLRSLAPTFCVNQSPYVPLGGNKWRKLVRRSSVGNLMIGRKPDCTIRPTRIS